MKQKRLTDDEIEQRLRAQLDALYREACKVAGGRCGREWWQLLLLELARSGARNMRTINILTRERGVDPAAGGGMAFALAAVRGDVEMLSALTTALGISRNRHKVH
ncbi:MAG: hypothetical protein ACYDBH_03030 [Acidobacteriaceae bacterium]